MNPRPTAQQISRSPNWANHAAVLCWIALWHNFEFARSRVDLAQPLQCDDFRPFWIMSFEFVKYCWIRFFSWESFIGFYIWCYPISTILACLFICEVAKFVEKVVLEREHGGRNAISCLLPCDSYIVWRVNLSKLSWVLVWALRKTTNCTLTFIQYFLQVLRSYIYSIHWNTVI